MIRKVMLIVVLAMVVFVGNTFAETYKIKRIFIAFESGESTVSTQEIYDRLDNFPEGSYFEVYGYTNEKGDFQRNEELAKARAEFLRKTLIGAIPDADIKEAQGFPYSNESSVNALMGEIRVFIPINLLEQAEIRDQISQIRGRIDALSQRELTPEQLKELTALSQSISSGDLAKTQTRLKLLEEKINSLSTPQKRQFQLRDIAVPIIIFLAIASLVISLAICFFVLITKFNQEEDINDEYWSSDINELAKQIKNPEFAGQMRICSFCQKLHSNPVRVGHGKLKQHFFKNSQCLSTDQKQELSEALKNI